MANYTVNDKTKKVIVTAPLTVVEQQLVGIYLGQGYKITEKSNARINEEDIIKYLEKKGHKDIIDGFNKEKDKKIKDKNGKERKAGYLVALKWLRANHADVYAAVKEAKSK